MPGKFVLNRSGTQFMFNLKAANGETILTSERYTTKPNAENGIASVKTNAPTDSRYERKTSKDKKPYFVLKAANNEIIGTSETYSSDTARDNGIASCKTNAPTAPTEDKSEDKPESSEVVQRVQRVMGRLSPLHAQVVAFYFLATRPSFDEIGAGLHISTAEAAKCYAEVEQLLGKHLPEAFPPEKDFDYQFAVFLDTQPGAQAALREWAERSWPKQILRIEIEFSDGATSSTIAGHTAQLLQAADLLYRAHGGRGLAIRGLHVEESLLVGVDS